MTESINVFTNKHGRRYYSIGKSYVKYDIEFPLEDALVMKDTQLKRYTCANCGDVTLFPDKDLFVLWNPTYGNWYCNGCFDEHMCNYMDKNNDINYAATDDNGRFCVGPEHCLNCNYNMVNGIFLSPCSNCLRYCMSRVNDLPMFNKKIGLDDWNKNDEYVLYEENDRIYKKIHKRFTDEDVEETDDDLPELVSEYSNSTCGQKYPREQKKISNLFYDSEISIEDDENQSINSDYNRNCPIFPM